MLEKFSVWLSYKLKSFSLVKKLHEYKLKKTPNVMIFALVLRNTSISSYQMLLQDFPFLSLLLEKWGYRCCKVCIERRKNIWECVLVKIFCRRYLMFQTCEFSKKLCHRCQRTTESSAFTLQGMLQRKSRVNWVFLLWTFGGWFHHQLHSRLLVHEISRRIGRTAPNLSI